MLNVSELTVIKYPDPRLRRRAAIVERFDSDLAAVARRMFELMDSNKGIGLAAPQVGLLLRLFVMRLLDDGAPELVFVNPQIVDPEGAVVAEEGCLSVPEVFVEKRRAERCRIRAQDLAGRPLEMSGAGLMARVWQHETDHLEGKLIIDQMAPSERIASKKKLRELEEEFAQSKKRA